MKGMLPFVLAFFYETVVEWRNSCRVTVAKTPELWYTDVIINRGNGDGMIILGAEGISKHFGERCLFDNISFSVQEKDAIGLVGANGVGKTTLFRMLTGQERVDSGLLSKSKQCRIGCMEQHVCADPNQTAYQHALSQFSHLLKLEEELEEIHSALEGGRSDADLLSRQQERMERYEREGGLTFRSRTRSALLGLGLAEAELSLPMASLSGGQRSKVSLARLLVSDANLLLLDEPTNHLDMTSVEWLEGYLRTYQNAFIVISHDRYFLDHVTNITFELEHERLSVCRGNYSVYLEQKAKDREVAAHHYEQTRREIARLEGIVAQQRQWNREKNIRTAESKLKVIQKLEKTLVKPEGELQGIRFAFSVKHTGANEVLSARGLGMRYGEKRLFQQSELSVFRRERVFLLGPNGCGKTTLLRLLTGQIQGDGEIRFGSGVVPGYFDQTQSNLHMEKTVLSEVWDDFPAMNQSEVRSALAAFLFRGDEVQKPVSMLSGGERARVAILKLMLTKANLLLLDEPTNHLDIASREALEQALADYDGTLLMVSHDRYFINKLADRVVAFQDGKLIEVAGNYEDYLAFAVAHQAPKEEVKAAVSKGGEDYRAKKEAQSKLRRAQGAVKRCEEALEKVSARMAEIDGLLSEEETAADYERLMSLSAERQELEEQELTLMEQWSEAEAELEQLQEEFQ